MFAKSTNSKFSLMVHGGSGNINSIEPFKEALSEALYEGDRLLKMGELAVNVVIRCVQILEDHPRLNAGTGSALNELGEIEMEAAVMDGFDLSVGAVAGIRGIMNPIMLAEKIRRDPNVVKIIGDGALNYALEHGFQITSDEHLITARQFDRYNKWKRQKSMIIDGEEEKLGTVGTVAIDRYGRLAAATSTGGLMGKRKGRVGDTSTVGAGTFANKKGAISATGKGEDFVRLTAASRVAFYIEQGLDAKDASRQIANDLEHIGGRGGVIVVDHNFNIGSAKTADTKGLAHGAVTSESHVVMSLEPSDVS